MAKRSKIRMGQGVGKMKPVFILDTNIFIYLFAGILKESLPDKVLGYSVITEIELLSYPGLTQKDEQQIRQLLSEMIDIALTKKIKQKTIQIRKKYKIKLPDAIISATAIVNNATLLTNDKQLLTIPELKSSTLNIQKEEKRNSPSANKAGETV